MSGIIIDKMTPTKQIGVIKKGNCIMTYNEAKLRIARDFINRYVEWLGDRNNDEMSNMDYAHKYGWSKISFGETKPKQMKNNQSTIIWFQSHIYCGHYIDEWSKMGIDKQVVYQLHKEGFFSYDYCSSYKARMLGRTDFYYINQTKAKELYRLYKDGFFNT